MYFNFFFYQLIGIFNNVVKYKKAHEALNFYLK